jgi:hypothetical protein
MKRERLLFVVLAVLVAALGVLYFLDSLENARRPAGGIYALSLGHDLIQMTNSIMLGGATKELTADLASILKGVNP